MTTNLANAMFFMLVVCIATVEGEEGFYAIAHMTNNARAVEYAIMSGANGVEVDIQFDHSTGDLTNFHHGVPCDCTCYFEIVQLDTVCAFDGACKGHTEHKAFLQYLGQQDRLALIYIDSKLDGMTSRNVLKNAGRNMVTAVEENVLSKGFIGDVVIGGTDGAYIKAVVKQAEKSIYKSQIFVTIDMYPSAKEALQIMIDTGYSNRIFSWGVVGNVFAWTVDKKSSMNQYLLRGARGIVSNFVGKLVQWTKERGLKLVQPGERLHSATNNKITYTQYCSCKANRNGCHITQPAGKNLACHCSPRCKGTVVGYQDSDSSFCENPDTSLGSCINGGGNCEGYSSRCDCSYSPGGCKVTSPALPGTACKCSYRGAWTCAGALTRCNDKQSKFCKNPDNSAASCLEGGGDCEGYKNSVCDCSYRRAGGCVVVKAAPMDMACRCSYRLAWTCRGYLEKCRERDHPLCSTPDTSLQSCLLGGGDCAGYKEYQCDCDYRRGGCVISKSAPRNTACKCNYQGFWTCKGEVTNCTLKNHAKCSHPDRTKSSCYLGGGDCGGY